MVNKTYQDERLSDGTKISDLTIPEEGIISSKVWSDPELYELELRRIFAKTWNFVAHETEIPNTNDYVTRFVGNDRVIVVRTEDGGVNVFLNACVHKGMHLCRQDHGNTKTFKCIYHGWTYRTNGTVAGVPAQKEAYGDTLDRNNYKLIQARVESYGGLIFATFNEEAPSLDEWLGDMKFYIDIYFNRTPQGMEVVGPPQRWVISANWKSAADNFSSDSYHAVMAHASGVALGQVPPDPRFTMYGKQIALQNGHGLGIVGGPPHVKLPEYLNYPEEIVNAAKEKLTPDQMEVFRKSNFVPGNIFPNLSFLNVMQGSQLNEQGPPQPFMTMRLWQPRGADEIEVFTWLLVDKEAPEWFKEQSKQNYIVGFGSSGTFEVDDAEVWAGMSRITKGVVAQERLELHYVMGMQNELVTDWPGPGKVSPTTFTEENTRNFFAQWKKFLTQK